MMADKGKQNRLTCRCKKSACGYEWEEYLSGFDDQDVDVECPACRAGGIEELREQQQAALDDIAEQNRQKAQYYHEKYGDPI